MCSMSQSQCHVDNFCSEYIHKYWDARGICQCPFCKRTFSPRPELQVNAVMSELAAEFKALVQVQAQNFLKQQMFFVISALS